MIQIIYLCCKTNKKVDKKITIQCYNLHMTTAGISACLLHTRHSFSSSWGIFSFYSHNQNLVIMLCMILEKYLMCVPHSHLIL